MKLSNYLIVLTAFLIIFSGINASANVCGDSEIEMALITRLDDSVSAWEEQPVPGQEDDGRGLIMRIFDHEGTLRMTLNKPDGPNSTATTLWASGPVTLCRAENGNLSIRGRLSATRHAPLVMRLGLNGDKTFIFEVINHHRFRFSASGWRREFAPYQ
jgi:hypothetical protein